jgi:hypothetical protein
LGCGAAFVIAPVLISAFLFVWAWSGAHCQPKPQCQRGAELNVLLEAMAVFAAAIVVGLALRSLVNWISARDADAGTSRGFIAGAVVLALAITAIAIVGGFKVMELILV